MSFILETYNGRVKYSQGQGVTYTIGILQGSSIQAYINNSNCDWKNLQHLT